MILKVVDGSRTEFLGIVWSSTYALMCHHHGVTCNFLHMEIGRDFQYRSHHHISLNLSIWLRSCNHFEVCIRDKPLSEIVSNHQCFWLRSIVPFQQYACILICTTTSTTWTPWLTTCATPLKGTTTATTLPSRLTGHEANDAHQRHGAQRHGPQQVHWLPGFLRQLWPFVRPLHGWRHTRQVTCWTTPRLRRLQSSGRCKCKSVVNVSHGR